MLDRHLHCLRRLASLSPSRSGWIEIPEESRSGWIEIPEELLRSVTEMASPDCSTGDWIETKGDRVRLQYGAPGMQQAVDLAATMDMIEVERALSLWQPYAWAVASGHKRIENRTWQPRKAVGTWVAIHASLTVAKGALEEVASITGAEPRIVRGAVVGVARLHEVIRSGMDVDQLSTEDKIWFNGPYGWFFKDAIELSDPIPCRGYQSLWHLGADVLTTLKGALRG